MPPSSVASSVSSGVLADRTYSILTADLEAFGNRLNEKHLAALRRIADVTSQMASGEINGRIAFDLPTGCGKTQSVVAWCQAVYELQSGHSAVIAASKVEELADVKRQLMAKGVPESAIGLVHSKLYDPDRADEWLRTREASVLKPDGGRRGREYASLPRTTDNEGRPFLLVTHSRVQSKRTNIGLLNAYNGSPRSLVLWDESLLVGEGRGVGKREISSDLAWLREWSGDDNAKQAVIAYFAECVECLNTELEAQKQQHRRPRAIRLPTLTPLEIDAYSRALGNRVQTKHLQTLLKFSQGDIRVIPVSQSGGGVFVSYDITVPRELTNIIVLDASYTIRELERLDRTIRHAPDFDGRVKRYDQVTINLLRHGSGRYTMERAFQTEDRKVSREICDVVANIPEDEACIIFTFKADEIQGAVNMRTALERDLRRFAGIDTTKATLADGRPRFRFLTWGQETACNDFKYATNVIFAGVIHRSDTDVSGSIVAQRDDLLTDVPGTLIADVKRSESAHALYQAMSRGSCRDTIDGQAKPMKVWLIHYDPQIQALLNRVMPGVNWETWTPNYLNPVDSKVDDLVVMITGYLRALPETVGRVSTRAIKAALWKDTAAAPAKMTVTRAIQTITEADSGWALDGRSLVRSIHGFTALAAAV